MKWWWKKIIPLNIGDHEKEKYSFFSRKNKGFWKKRFSSLEIRNWKRKSLHFIFSTHVDSLYHSTPWNLSSFSRKKITHRKLSGAVIIFSTGILILTSTQPLWNDQTTHYRKRRSPLLLGLGGFSDSNFSDGKFSDTIFPTANFPTNKFSETTFSDNKFSDRHIFRQSKLF